MRLSLVTAAILLVCTSSSWAVEETEILDLVPADGADSVDVVAEVDSPSLSTLTNARQKSILNLSDEQVVPKVVKTAAPSQALDDERSEREVSRIESSIDRKMQSLQRSVNREETKLESVLADLGKQRETALAKSDEKRLKRIEALEKKAVEDYERRVEKLLNSAVLASEPKTEPRSKGSGQASSKRPTQAQNDRANAKRKSTSTRSSSEDKNRRRFRLWPFR